MRRGDGGRQSQLTAGPSTSAPTPLDTAPDGHTVEIPSYGIEFFEYRRSLFLAGRPLPVPPTSTPLPSSYAVSFPSPFPQPPRSHVPKPTSSVGRLEALLADPEAVESDHAWESGVRTVSKSLTDGKRLAKPLRLGLVIKILRAGWLRDGTWPTDPKTFRAIPPPDSPLLRASADSRMSDHVPILGHDSATVQVSRIPVRGVTDKIAEDVWRGVEVINAGEEEGTASTDHG